MDVTLRMLAHKRILHMLAQLEVPLGYDRSAPRRPVNLSLNSDLVERSKAKVENFSAYVEELLATDLARREAKADAEKARTAAALDGFATLYRKSGSLSEELEAS
jgi:antitoxin CcdA